ncbi:MAG: HPr(Ser) kinase/phosphatase [Tumebacillaceae bacterium]
MQRLTVNKMVHDLGLTVLAGESGLDNGIVSDDFNRPGLEFAGFLNYFAPEKIQLVGKKEVDYLLGLPADEREESIRRLLEYPLPAIILTSSISTVKYLTLYANKHNIPLLRTDQNTTKFAVRLHSYLEKELAPQTGLHGTFLDIYGVGVLLRGVSGIGKSEVALSLIERGHRLVADDLVNLKRLDPDTIQGSATEVNTYFLSLRGIGLLNIRELYGAGAIREVKNLNLEIELVPWEECFHYDALGSEDEHVTHLEVRIPKIVLPVKPGRDLAELVQVAAKNHRLKASGYDPRKDFFERLQKNWGN